MAEPVVLINAFEVPADEAGPFIEAWERTRDFLQAQPGYVDTALHQAVTPGAEFQFVNIARWQSTEAFMAATQSPGFGESAAGLAGYRPHPGLYRAVRT
jgi:heme oxygenase (mycobilin-producing)